MRLVAQDCVVLVIDVQEKLMPVVDRGPETLARIGILIDGLKLLGVPLVVSEQYPKGLGATLPEVTGRLDGVTALAKLSFSCCDDPALMAALEASGKKTVVVCGVEAHVCVQQTVTDLAARGFLPVVPADAVSSRQAADVARALARMTAEGAVITGTESLLFELTRRAGTDTFKAISKLVK